MNKNKRMPGEDFEHYKKRRKLQNQNLKDRLRNHRIIWNSANMVLDQKSEPGDERIAKVVAQGTFRKAKDKLSPHSQSTRNIYDKLKAKAMRALQLKSEEEKET